MMDDTEDSVGDEKPSVEYEKLVVDVDMEDQTDDGDKSHDEDGPHDGDKIHDGDKEGDDDDDDWITPSNIKAVKSKLGMQDDALISDTDVKCGCLTTDFAMQNVLIQMGLHVISVDGRLIRQARSYIQKCFGCHKETHDMTHVFCPSCGNKTLMRVAVTISEDGTMQYHYPKRGRNHNIRGTKYSLPQPKGGRHLVCRSEDGAQKHAQTEGQSEPTRSGLRGSFLPFRYEGYKQSSVQPWTSCQTHS